MLLMVVLVAQVLHLPLQVHLLLTQVAVAVVAQLLAEQVVLETSGQLMLLLLDLQEESVLHLTFLVLA
jgi:hypothetical protein